MGMVPRGLRYVMMHLRHLCVVKIDYGLLCTVRQRLRMVVPEGGSGRAISLEQAIAYAPEPTTSFP